MNGNRPDNMLSVDQIFAEIASTEHKTRFLVIFNRASSRAFYFLQRCRMRNENLNGKDRALRILIFRQVRLQKMTELFRALQQKGLRPNVEQAISILKKITLSRNLAVPTSKSAGSSSDQTSRASWGGHKNVRNRTEVSSLLSCPPFFTLGER